MEQGARPRTRGAEAPLRVPGQGRTAPLETGGEPLGGARGAHPHDEPGPPCPARRMPQRLSLRDQVLRGLRDALVTGELRPGAVYSAPALAERFEVSATPVREAMQQLAREGAVEVVHNRGFRVAERTARDRAELAEVRALLEVPVLLRLARGVPRGRWESLRPLAQATVAAAADGDRAAYAQADRAFHGAALGLAGNDQLVAVAGQLHRRAQWAHTAELMADALEHVALLNALVAGDVPAAESVVRAHFG